MKLLNTLILALALLLPLAAPAASPVNINTADKETLATAISGVGETKAEAIIQYREKHGPFKSVDEITEVKGIGQGILDKNRENLSVE